MRFFKVLRICVSALIAFALILVLYRGITGDGFDMSFLGNFASAYSYADSDSYTVGGASVRADNVDSVEISWISGAVNVRVYDGDEIVFSESSTRGLDPDEMMRYRLKNGRLTLQYCAPRTGWNPFSGLNGKQLEVLLPASLALSEMKIDSVSSGIDMDGSGTRVKKLTVSTVSGGVGLTGFTADALILETVSGSQSAEGAFADIRVNSVSGSAGLRLWTMPDALRAESVSGSVRVILPENDGFTATLESVSGGLSTDFATMTGRKTAEYKGGGVKLRFDSVSGSVNIELDARLGEMAREAAAKPQKPAKPQATVRPTATPTGGSQAGGSGRSF